MKPINVRLIIIVLCLFSFSACKKSSMNATKSLIAGPDKELVEALKQQSKRDSINRTPEEREARRRQQERLAEIAEIREAEIKRLRAEGGETAAIYNDELENEEKWEMSYNMGLVFVAFILSGFGFLLWWFVIRKIRNNIRDMSYTRSEVTNKFNSAMNDPRFENMSDEEHEAMENMKKFINRK